MGALISSIAPASADEDESADRSESSVGSWLLDAPPFEFPDDVVFEGDMFDLAGSFVTWGPLDLIAGEWMHTYSLGTDTLEVWRCDVGEASGPTLGETIALLDEWVVPYYAEISRGRYLVDFIPGGTVIVDDSRFCKGNVEYLAGRDSVVSEGALMIVGVDRDGSGVAYSRSICFPGDGCTFPDNGRISDVDITLFEASPPAAHGNLVTTVHEMGHMLSFPHSYSGASGSQYDNPIEFMSGNLVVGKYGLKRSDYPLLTLAINRYAAGWIDPSEVRRIENTGGRHVVEIVTYDKPGVKMVAMVGARGAIGTLEARRSGPFDPITEEFEGVPVHVVGQVGQLCASPIDGWCVGVSRAQLQLAAVKSSMGWDHVLKPGDTVAEGFFSITVLERTENGYLVQVVVEGPRFLDVPDSHTFAADIDWMADAGITKGCNPPTNDLFCPDSVVTRGQMAAFLVRALGLTERLDNPFTDDDESVFEADIERLAAAGITKGCNPPANTLFCSDGKVTREQMAAFLVRALGYTDNGGGDLFSDDDLSIFEADIDRMATAGVTKGCNPPVNDRFCPTSYVTRGQMAAFLHRALG
jgi:hypothetical protein